MSMRYKQKPVTTGVTRFTSSPMADIEFSRMTANPVWILPFNAGDIIPCYYAEVLPHDTFEISLDFVIRQMTALHPTMGDMEVDFYAFFVPNRIINESWKNIQSENTSGFWTAPEVSLVPLYTGSSAVQVPVGSIADYYGFPTQRAIDASVLNQCNDLKFRGYLEIYNNYFRDENYQSPIPYSKLNLYNGFFEPVNTPLGLVNRNLNVTSDELKRDGVADGAVGLNSLVKSMFGDGGKMREGSRIDFIDSPRLSSWTALGKPLKANKLHDFITSALPAPQKGSEVYFGIGDLAPLTPESDIYNISGVKLQFGDAVNGGDPTKNYNLQFFPGGSTLMGGNLALGEENTNVSASDHSLKGTNLYADLSKSTGISVNDLRIAVATQQVYETLARGGSRYTELIRSFFGVETENPFKDIPTKLGHVRRKLDLYQVAQTSQSTIGENGSPQGELTAFGYTTNGGHLFTQTFLEHGYVHIMAVVRQRNIYSTFLSPDNFRLSTLDFYLPQFANIGEQPIRRAVLHPFGIETMEDVLGYQEAWWEYRYEPDRCVGLFRSGVPESLDVWTYADNFDTDFRVVDGDWLKSNAEEVLNRTIAVTSEVEPQFKGLFSWKITKQRPMPTYSVPGLDTI